MRNLARSVASLALVLISGSATAQTPPPGPHVGADAAVVSGFSGVLTIAPQATASRKPNADLLFINLEGASARIFGIGVPGAPIDGRLVAAPTTFDVLAKDVGQVFGIALDDQQAPNIYLGATSAFGLNLVARGHDGKIERRQTGGPGVGWMQGQFGLGLQGDPGSIYRIDGKTGAPSLFARVMLDGVPNPGPGLGALAYDAAHKQLFASDLYTGMIHRFGIADGAEIEAPFDHGVTARKAAQMPPVAFDASKRPNLASSQFNAENPATWGFAPPERRVWALALHEDRLFYSVRNGATDAAPQIWSVGLVRDGAFGGDARLEVEIPAQPGPYPVSDIAFTPRGAMIVAQRAPIAASYDFSKFTVAGTPRVLRFWLKDLKDPHSLGLWKPAPEEYAVGFAGDYRNSDGGVALGYGYDRDGRLDIGACAGSLLVTGDRLRLKPALRERLEPGGPMQVDGVQITSVDGVLNPSAPEPWASYFFDYDGKFDMADWSGHVGVVRTLTPPCAGQGGGGVIRGGGSMAGGGGSGGGGDGGGGDDCVGDDCGKPKACFASTGELVCDKATGKWVYKVSVTGAGWANAVSAVSLTPPVVATGGSFPLNPASIPLTGPPGSSATLEICVFDAAAATSSKPYDCCRAKVRVTIPNQSCRRVK